MICESELTKKHYKTGDVAKIISVSTRTTQHYDIDSITHSEILPNGCRAFPCDKVMHFLNSSGVLYHDNAEKRYDVVDARVSSYIN